jgi:hypothetical protein
MGDLVDTRAVGPPIHIRLEIVDSDRSTPEVVAGRSAPADPSGDVAHAAFQDGPYRKIYPDLSCIRLIAASAIVAGLLLGTAPVALAQVGYLIATAPAAFAQEIPTQGASGAGGVEPEHPDIQSDNVDRTAQYRSDSHAVISMFSWKGTSQAVRCSYGLLIGRNTQACQAA